MDYTLANTCKLVLSWWAAAAPFNMWVVWTRWRREGLTPCLPEGKRSRGREKTKTGGEIDICTPDVLWGIRTWFMKYREDFWSQGSVTTGCIVTEITSRLPLRLAYSLFLLLLCVCAGCLSFGYIHNTNTSTHTHRRTYFLPLPQELLHGAIMQYKPVMTTCQNISICCLCGLGRRWWEGMRPAELPKDFF